MFSAPGEHCPPGMEVLDDDTCHEALKLYNIDATDLHENKLLHPKGCHVMHLDGKWHFNTGGSPWGHIMGGAHHDICLIQREDVDSNILLHFSNVKRLTESVIDVLYKGS